MPQATLAAMARDVDALRPRRLVDTRGLLTHAALPALGLHGGLGVIAFGIARVTNRVEVKDYLWPAGMIINAWWTAVGRHTFRAPHDPVVGVIGGMSFGQKALLGAVTVWGARLFHRVVSRSLNRGDDDVRYQEVKNEPGFWSTTAPTIFALEAVFQTIIALPFSVPFRLDTLHGLVGAPVGWAPWIRSFAAGLFTTGLALETIADWQLDSHKQRGVEAKTKGDLAAQSSVCTTGVFSIVRHPNYLGDALCHAAFPLWCYGSRLFTPWLLAGPVANYFFLRVIGGDRQNEASQLSRYSAHDHKKYDEMKAFQRNKNSFWPRPPELVNPWTWTLLGVGATVAVAEAFLESHLLHPAEGLPASIVSITA